MSMLTPQGVDERRRQGFPRRAVAVLVALTVLAVTAFAAWYVLVRDVEETSTKAACPPVRTVAPVKLPPAVAAKKVPLNVYNATTRSGLAATVAGEMAKRGFPIGAVSNDPAKRRVTAAAEVRHGPKGSGAARTVAAHVDGQVVLVPDRRAGLTVDLVVGAAWKRPRTPAAAANALKAAPAKTAPRPAGC